MHETKPPSVPGTPSVPNPQSLAVIDGASLLALDVEPPKFVVARLVPNGASPACRKSENRQILACFMALPPSFLRGQGVGVRHA